MSGFIDDFRGKICRRLAAFGVFHKLYADHRSQPADLANAGMVSSSPEALKSGLQARTDFFGPSEQSFVLENVQDRQRGCTRQRIARVSAAKAPAVDRVHDFRPANHGCNRQTGPKALACSYQIRLNVEILYRKQPPRPPEARLDLISNQHYAVSVADPSKSSKKVSGRRQESTFTLNRLDDNCGNF